MRADWEREALIVQENGGWPWESSRDLVLEVLRAVEPIIRADEREKAARRAENATTHHEFCLSDGTVFDTLVSLNDVCALINPGGSDE